MEHKPNDSDTKDISKRAWYVIHTFSGYENKVKANLDKKVIAQDLGDVIFNVVVPMREESEFKDGKRRVVKKKLIPGYVMVDMIVNNYSWFVVRNTNGVTGFVGSEKEPIPLTFDEAQRILVELAEEHPEDIALAFEVGDRVRIISGLFEGRVATVKAIDFPRQRVKVLVENALVDLDVNELEKM